MTYAHVFLLILLAYMSGVATIYVVTPKRLAWLDELGYGINDS